jgi:hypothetical protein
MVAQVGYSMVGRLGDQVTPCVICTVHKETWSMGFLVEPRNQGRRFVSGLASKPLGRFMNGLASNGFSLSGLKIGSMIFSGLASKSVAMIFLV